MARLLAMLVVLGLTTVGPARAEGRSVRIAIDNRTPEFDLVPTIEVFGGSSKAFSKLDNSHFEYAFIVADSEWFNVVDIKLHWAKAFLLDDGTRTDFDQTIQLRIRRDFPPSFAFPVFFGNARSDRQMSRLEEKQDPTDQFEVFFRAWQIAAYFRDALGTRHPYSKRAAKIFFYAAVHLAEQPNYFVAMNDTAEKFATDSFDDNGFAQRATAARSVYWYDLRQIDVFASKGDCSTARLLLDAFRTLKDAEPDAFNAQYKGDPNVLVEKEKIIEMHCSK